MAVVIAFAWATSGCSQSSRTPVGPSPPPPPPPRPALEVTGLLPSVGSTAGGATVKIVGTGLMPGMVVMFDDIKVTARTIATASFTAFSIEAPPHAVGTVDLVVTNPDGQSQRLADGYTYATQESFDLNGVWAGFTLNGSDTAVDFVIRDNRLVSGSCGYEVLVPFTFSDLPGVQGGEFSAVAEGGGSISGRIVSESEIMGTISFPKCNPATLPWRVNRQDD